MEKFNLKTEYLRLERPNQENVEEFQTLDNSIMRRKYVWDNELIYTLTENEIMEQDQFGLGRPLLRENGSSIRHIGLWHILNTLWRPLVCALKKPFSQRGYVFEIVSKTTEYAFEILGFTHIMVVADGLYFAFRKMAKWLAASFGDKKIENNRPTLFYKICKYITSGITA